MTVTDAAPAVEAHALTKRYGRRRGVQQVSPTVEAGQICAPLGPTRLQAAGQRSDGRTSRTNEPLCGAFVRHVGR